MDNVICTCRLTNKENNKYYGQYNLCFRGGDINLKTQTITKTVSIGTYSRQQVTFTFGDLKEVIGVSDITKTATSNAFGKYQDLGQRNVIPVSFISISGNTVTLGIWGQVDTTSEAQWSVTAIGK